MVEWHTSFIRYLLAIPLIILFLHFSHLIDSLTKWKYMIITQLIDFPWFTLDIIITYFLLKYYTLSFW